MFSPGYSATVLEPQNFSLLHNNFNYLTILLNSQNSFLFDIKESNDCYS